MVDISKMKVNSTDCPKCNGDLDIRIGLVDSDSIYGTVWCPECEWEKDLKWELVEEQNE